MANEFKPNELFVYVNGSRWELGMVKRPNNSGDGYFCWYSRGDTAANTPLRCMRKLENAGWTHIEQALDDAIEEIVELCGSCPSDQLELGSDGCDERCREGIEGECWKDFLTKAKWND